MGGKQAGERRRSESAPASSRMQAPGGGRDDPLHGRKLKIGIISPYSFEIPGGVQLHIRDFATELIRRGHRVSVLAPGRRTKDMPLWVQTNGSSFSIPYNGSVAELSYFGFVGLQTRRWVRQGHFDILHLHEPEAPSLSHKPLTMIKRPPMVATFHAAFDPYPMALRFFQRYLQRFLKPLDRAICVSKASLHSALHYLPACVDKQIVPNGINCAQFADAEPVAQWRGTKDHPTIGFLGRMGETRKGFLIFATAALSILERYPGARFLCAGDGEEDGRRIIKRIDPTGRLARCCEFLGRISDDDKAGFYHSLSAYVAPQTGGESFGIVLVEAMAASCPVVASDLPAFRDVSDGGTALSMFATGDARECAAAIDSLLADDAERERLSKAGLERSQQYDWSAVADSVLKVYASVLS